MLYVHKQSWGTASENWHGKERRRVSRPEEASVIAMFPSAETLTPPAFFSVKGVALWPAETSLMQLRSQQTVGCCCPLDRASSRHVLSWRRALRWGSEERVWRGWETFFCTESVVLQGLQLLALRAGSLHWPLFILRQKLGTPTPLHHRTEVSLVFSSKYLMKRC